MNPKSRRRLFVPSTLVAIGLMAGAAFAQDEIHGVVVDSTTTAHKPADAAAAPAPATSACPRAESDDDLAHAIAQLKPFSAQANFMSNPGFLRYCLYERRAANDKGWIAMTEARVILVGHGFDPKQIHAMEQARQMLPPETAGEPPAPAPAPVPSPAPSAAQPPAPAPEPGPAGASSGSPDVAVSPESEEARLLAKVQSLQAALLNPGKDSVEWEGAPHSREDLATMFQETFEALQSIRRKRLEYQATPKGRAAAARSCIQQTQEAIDRMKKAVAASTNRNITWEGAEYSPESFKADVLRKKLEEREACRDKLAEAIKDGAAAAPR